MLNPQTDKAREERRKAFHSSDAALKFWTNVSLLNAVLIGVFVVFFHGGKETAGLAWAGASLALGGMLGFLFGIPGRSQGVVQINQPGFAAIDTEIKRATGTGGTPFPEGNVTATAEGTVVTGPAAEKPADPAAAQGTPPPAPRAVSNSQQDSHSEPSNLEQVSDWVTKLLLGGGLTQLQQIPRMIWELSLSVAVGINPTAKGQELWGEQSFAAGVLIYFFVVGFFGGYLITKLQLGRKLRS